MIQPEFQLPEAQYDGFVRMSDADAPQIYNHQLCAPAFKATDTPFLLEAEFYNPADNIAYSIRYREGNFQVVEHKIQPDDFNSKDVDHLYQMPLPRGEAKALGGKMLHFLQYWIEQEDALCENMPVLVPAQRVFIGFSEPKHLPSCL